MLNPCPRCGQPVASGVRRCPNCGQYLALKPLPPPEELLVVRAYATRSPEILRVAGYLGVAGGVTLAASVPLTVLILALAFPFGQAPLSLLGAFGVCGAIANFIIGAVEVRIALDAIHGRAESGAGLIIGGALGLVTSLVLVGGVVGIVGAGLLLAAGVVVTTA